MLLALVVGCCASKKPVQSVESTPPTLFIIGDSTVKNSTRGQRGWGEVMIQHFDTNRIRIENHATGGRSSRTFLTEGRWDKVSPE